MTKVPSRAYLAVPPDYAELPEAERLAVAELLAEELRRRLTVT